MIDWSICQQLQTRSPKGFSCDSSEEMRAWQEEKKKASWRNRIQRDQPKGGWWMVQKDSTSSLNFNSCHWIKWDNLGGELLADPVDDRWCFSLFLIFSSGLSRKHLRTIGFYLKSNNVHRDLQVLQKTTTIISLRIVETETTHKVNSFAFDSIFRYQKVKTSIQQVLHIDKIFFWVWMRQK